MRPMLKARMACMIFLIGAMAAGTAGCRSQQHIAGESLVLAGERPGKLLGEKVDPKSVVVRLTYEPSAGGTVYEVGRDYRVDPKNGTITRVPGSRIPDFSSNVLFGKKDFNHGEFPNYGNGRFFVYVDYAFAKPLKLTSPRDVSGQLPRTAAKLRAGEAIKVIAFGDSITAGGEASSVALQYPSRYMAYLRSQFPRANITLENGATGGDNTVMGLQRLEEKVLSRGPDLVLVAFGMNDHNRAGVGGVDPAEFGKNLVEMVHRIRERTKAEVILLSTFPPNPDWHFSSHRMAQYAAATEQAARDCNAAYADVFSVWQIVLARKDPSSLLANNINHPNDFGHWLYLQALEALRF
jgi:lysophospholipase L1-like esterase